MSEGAFTSANSSPGGRSVGWRKKWEEKEGRIFCLAAAKRTKEGGTEWNGWRYTVSGQDESLPLSLLCAKAGARKDESEADQVLIMEGSNISNPVFIFSASLAMTPD